MAPTNGQDSRRWMHFSSALQLAIQRASHKWTYEDFCECFSTWCEEHPEGGAGMYKLVSEHMESTIRNNCDELFTRLEVKKAVDTLHSVVTDARTHLDSGDIGPDVWIEALDPWGAVRARTVPVMQKERDRLKAQLAKIKEENRELQRQMQENVHAKHMGDGKIQELMNLLDEVYDQWKQLPWDEIEVWGVQTRDSLKAAQPV